MSTKNAQSLPKREILELSNALNRLSTNTEVLTQCCTALTRRTRQLTSLTTPAWEMSAALIQAASNVTSTLTLMKEAKDKFDLVAKGELSTDKVYVGAKEYYEWISKTTHADTLVTQGNNSSTAAKQIPIGNKEEGDSSSRGVARNIQRALKFAVGAQSNNSNVDNTGSNDTRKAETENRNPTILYMQDKRGGDADDNLDITEQDVYAAADALELLKNTYSYFTRHEDDETLHKNNFNIDPFDDNNAHLDRRRWKSTASTLRNIENAHQRGVEGMCFLIKAHLLKAGPAIRMKRPLVVRGDATITTVPVPKAEMGKDIKSTAIMQVPYESAAEARIRFNTAVQNRDLVKSIGEYEEYLPLTTKMVRELRAIFECLGEKKTFWGCALGDNVIEEMNVIINMNMKKKLSMNEVTRTEAIGSGRYCNLCMVCYCLYISLLALILISQMLPCGLNRLRLLKKLPLRTGFPQLDAYAETRKIISLQCIEHFHNTVKREQSNSTSFERSGGDLDAVARDVVRCLENALVVAAGEKVIVVDGYSDFDKHPILTI